MDNKFSKIYKNRVDKIRTKVQKDFYYHANNKSTTDERDFSPPKEVDKAALLKKINNIFSRPDYVYQTDVIIMYKNGESKQKNIVGIKDNYLITIGNEKIMIDDILDVK